jgi:hypothetical protein
MKPISSKPFLQIFALMKWQLLVNREKAKKRPNRKQV